MAAIEITGTVFRWARERVEITPERLAKTIQTKPEKIRAWEAGEAYPNFRQAQKLASALSVPLGYLFLHEPPDLRIPIADFRTLPGKENASISPNLQDVLDDALRKRDWYREWRQEEGFGALEFVEKYTSDSDRASLVLDMRSVLDMPADFPASMGNWTEHLRAFVQHAEAAGILVLQNGIVGNNTRRKLSVQEFRGFALADKFAPLIFINSVDSTAAKIFTLAHELVHIWTGTSGISNPEIVPEDRDIVTVESFCNAVGAEFLVPASTIRRRWDKYRRAADNAQALARYFLVSAQVILRRSYELGLIAPAEFFPAFREVQGATKARAAGKGGAFYNNFISRNSRRFTKEVVSAVSGGHITYGEASRLLNAHAGTIFKVIGRLT